MSPTATWDPSGWPPATRKPTPAARRPAREARPHRPHRPGRLTGQDNCIVGLRPTALTRAAVQVIHGSVCGGEALSSGRSVVAEGSLRPGSSQVRPSRVMLRRHGPLWLSGDWPRSTSPASRRPAPGHRRGCDDGTRQIGSLAEIADPRPLSIHLRGAQGQPSQRHAKSALLEKPGRGGVRVPAGWSGRWGPKGCSCHDRSDDGDGFYFNPAGI
jgi:hypothetical protein